MMRMAKPAPSPMMNQTTNPKKNDLNGKNIRPRLAFSGTRNGRQDIPHPDEWQGRLVACGDFFDRRLDGNGCGNPGRNAKRQKKRDRHEERTGEERARD